MVISFTMSVYASFEKQTSTCDHRELEKIKMRPSHPLGVRDHRFDKLRPNLTEEIFRSALNGPSKRAKVQLSTSKQKPTGLDIVYNDRLLHPRLETQIYLQNGDLYLSLVTKWCARFTASVPQFMFPFVGSQGIHSSILFSQIQNERCRRYRM